MPTRAHKCRKKRGHRKMGYGRVGNHHKHPGGRGMSGSKHHHKTWVNRWHPGYFGKRGMNHYHLLRNRTWCPAINVNEVWRLVPENIKRECLKSTDKSKAPLIDVVEAGYAKVTGKGKMPPQPVVVRARYFSKTAQEKIKSVGGRCLLRA
mmetsp:Transcript_12075/g.18223  ORF Transcript_12075/g.18223 Transcript_12075/m.18223 type:complete len:150 (+) Transcript_12075:164-613(+)